MQKVATVLSILALCAACTQPNDSAPHQAPMPSSDTQERTDWPTYGQDLGGQRFSTLDQVHAGNVAGLEIAWEYHMRPAANAAPAEGDIQALAEGVRPDTLNQDEFRSSQQTPLVVNDRMYFATPWGKVVAADPTSGEEIWVHQLPEGVTPARRGLEFWAGDNGEGATVFVGTEAGTLIALSAGSGTPVDSFGDAGTLDLATPDVVNPDFASPFGISSYRVSSPPLAFKNLIITGGANGEYPPRGARGDIRAWDARTGELVWRYEPVPENGGPGFDTWAQGSLEWRRGVCVWGFMTVDAENEILYLPFGSPAWDRYGVDRLGRNEPATSLVAVDANTGEYLWHFQTVHHDIWDYDLTAPPTLFDVRRDGETIPVVAVITKASLLFILNRLTGEPIFGVEERPVPASDVPGEEAWPTQPFPVAPPPLGRMSFTLDDIAMLTPEHTQACLEWIGEHDMQMGGPYLPPGYNQTTIMFPSFIGGSNYQGTAFNPRTRYLYANISGFGQVYSLVDSPDGGALPVRSGPVSGRFFQPGTRLPCNQPPWGELVAVDIDTGEIAWRSILGITDDLPEGLQRTGRPSLGGAIATAGGLIFIGGTDDSRFRAFDAASGEMLWETRLEASANATPITYLGSDGRQYIAVVATGGSLLGARVTGDSVIAWALPPD